MAVTQDPTQRLPDAASVWASTQAAALPDHARWSVGRRLELDGWDVVLAISLQHGVARVFVPGDGGEPELAATMRAVEAAE